MARTKADKKLGATAHRRVAGSFTITATTPTLTSSSYKNHTSAHRTAPT
jgi:hypothetical protein